MHIRRKIPIRTFRQAMRYVIPYRLTLDCNPAIYAWLWWNIGR